jgi:molecular chaperone DnaJ
MELRLSGMGAQGRNGGPPGDLYVSLHVAAHPVFERRGQDLVCALVIPMTQAALGVDVEIPTLEGTEKVQIKPGIASGTVLHLRGKGLANPGRRGRGDLLVTVVVETPSPKSKQERALLEQLADLRDERPSKAKGLAGKLRRLLEG